MENNQFIKTSSQQCPCQESLINVEYGGFWLRFFAIIIDALVLHILLFLFVFMLYIGLIIANINTIEAVSETQIKIIGNVFIVTLYWLYFTISESSIWQATIGKSAMGLVVTDEYGKRISFLQANVRYWSKFISAILFMVGFLMAAFTSKKQALHDMIAGTLVVRVC